MQMASGIDDFWNLFPISSDSKDFFYLSDDCCVKGFFFRTSTSCIGKFFEHFSYSDLLSARTSLTISIWIRLHGESWRIFSRSPKNVLHKSWDFRITLFCFIEIGFHIWIEFCFVIFRHAEISIKNVKICKKYVLLFWKIRQILRIFLMFTNLKIL